MYINEKRILGLSVIASLTFHILLFFLLYFLNFKPFKKEEEKIITVSLDLPPLQGKPSSEKEDKIEEKPQAKPTPEPVPEKQQTPITKPELPQTPKPLTPLPNQNQTPQPTQETIQQPPPQPTQPPSQPLPQPAQPQKIDLTAGRQEQIKPPPKKDEDVDGYLKDLIRYLNQQARERDLYPPIAKRLKIEGQVVVRVTINEDGTIEENSMTIVESSGYNVLDKGSLDILRKLQPLKKPPKRITVEIPIVFQIIYM